MKLIREEIEQVEFIVENRNGKKSLYIEGVFLQGNIKNRNGRMYPMETLRREVSRYNENHVQAGRALGELDHPESPVVNLKNVCCNVVDIWEDGDDIRGNIEILTTPTGNIVRDLIRNNIRLGVSSRGMGSVKNMSEGTVEVQEDFNLICFDIVSNPSTHGAFITENTSNKMANPYENIDKLIHDFLSEVR